jgi:oxepin-CoA hydrolase/3-oxo-5,6-dehydrosuberyl-CoA semialdehyde dehydrogenase
MTVVPSYVAGRWHRPADGQPLRDAVTGEEVARISTEGVDLGAAMDYARAVGGPALRALTFHQRAALVKRAAEHLREQRDQLYALSACAGATRYDARFDVDGGLAVLLAYASRAKRELPDDTIYVEGAVEVLGKGGRFLGQHVLTTRPGVAVQINAFNFPVWGPMEKLAPALLAGMPSVIKSASQTAYLTARVVEMLVDAEILPDGVVQLVSGSAPDLLDHVMEHDMVSFTGSAATAERLRTHPAIARRAVPFNSEADSLNCSILGLDVAPGSVEFDLYVDEVVTEMTVKAGQKCTAIRRAFVPAAHIDAVVDALSQRLAAIAIGNPANPDVRMGALVSIEQRDEVRRAVKVLAGAGRIVFGDPDTVVAVDADAERGAFMSPILLLADDAWKEEPHDVEAFGPVSTVLPYASVDEVVSLAARGRGSLVGSIVTGDADFARQVVVGAAPWHGRLLILDVDGAPESTGHGAPPPSLVHGGPGRAGGGEELGGLRAVFHHLQRTAVQGSPNMLAAVTGRWVPGAARRSGDVHPFRKSLAELRVGDSVTAGPRVVTRADVDQFAAFTGDTFYAHTDEEAAAANPLFGGIVAHGYLVLSFAAGLFVSPEPGPVLANYGLENLRFLTPVRPGDSLTVTLTAAQITPRPRADYGEVRWDVVVTNQDETPVATYQLLTMVASE